MSAIDIGLFSQQILSELKIETWLENQTTSTNNIARDEASQITVPLKVYLTNHQTAGRGPNQNTWTENGQGQALLSSWSFSFEKNPQPILAPLLGLAIYQSLVKAFGHVRFSLKAPNDILIDHSKVCGILIENILTGSNGRCIVGIGLNVFGSPSNLGATHLSAHADVNEQNWKFFLTNLVPEVRRTVLQSQKDLLSPESCFELLHALQKNPLLQDQLIEVTPQGSLQFRKSKINWQDL